MTISSFCLKQRQQEQEKLKRFLAVSLAGSAVLHGVIAVAFSELYEKPQVADDPIELIIVEQPEVPEPPKPPTPQQPREIEEPVETQLSSQAAPLKPKASAPPIPQPAPETRVPAPQAAPTKPKPSPSSASPPTRAKPEPRPQRASQPSPLQSTRERKPDFTSPAQPIPDSKEPNPAVPPRRGNVSEPTQNSSQGSQQLGEGLRGDSAPSTSGNRDSNANSTAPETVATNRAPERPKPDGGGGLQCISNCQPTYPSSLDGAEGSAAVRITVDSSGNVANAILARANSNSQINEQALTAARKMKFAAPSGGVSASAQVTINFTLAGSDFDRIARERQEEKEQERQAQLERERQARLERERQAQLERARQAELQRQQQPAQP